MRASSVGLIRDLIRDEGANRAGIQLARCFSILFLSSFLSSCSLFFFRCSSFLCSLFFFCRSSFFVAPSPSPSRVVRILILSFLFLWHRLPLPRESFESESAFIHHGAAEGGGVRSSDRRHRRRHRHPRRHPRCHPRHHRRSRRDPRPRCREAVGSDASVCGGRLFLFRPPPIGGGLAVLAERLGGGRTRRRCAERVQVVRVIMARSRRVNRAMVTLSSGGGAAAAKRWRRRERGRRRLVCGAESCVEPSQLLVEHARTPWRWRRRLALLLLMRAHPLELLGNALLTRTELDELGLEGAKVGERHTRRRRGCASREWRRRHQQGAARRQGAS